MDNIYLVAAAWMAIALAASLVSIRLAGCSASSTEPICYAPRRPLSTI
ncbi:MAG TPA: hypothetical protein VF371_04740 [Candidatus Limnocylindrales bacterium]|jgi:hypothetical protein